MKKKSNTYKKMLFVVLFIVVTLFFIVLALETNVFVRQAGTTSYKFISINSFVDEYGAGYVVLNRHEDTPIALEYISFNNGNNYKYIVLNEQESLNEQLIITLPETIESGIYYVHVEAVINGQSFTKTISFRVL